MTGINDLLPGNRPGFHVRTMGKMDKESGQHMAGLVGTLLHGKRSNNRSFDSFSQL